MTEFFFISVRPDIVWYSKGDYAQINPLIFVFIGFSCTSKTTKNTIASFLIVFVFLKEEAAIGKVFQIIFFNIQGQIDNNLFY